MRLAVQSITDILRQGDHLLLLQSAPNQLNAHVGAIVDLGVIWEVISFIQKDLMWSETYRYPASPDQPHRQP